MKKCKKKCCKNYKKKKGKACKNCPLFKWDFLQNKKGEI